MALHSPWIVLLGASLRRMSSGTMGCIIHMSKYNQVILFVFFFILRLRIFLTSMFFPPKSTKNDHISCKHSRAFLVSFFFLFPTILNCTVPALTCAFWYLIRLHPQSCCFTVKCFIFLPTSVVLVTPEANMVTKAVFSDAVHDNIILGA